LTLVPVTLLVPGLYELVQVAHGGSATDSHLFMTVNMISGIVAVPVVLRLVRRWPNIRRWLAALLLVDAVAFVGMGWAPSLPVLFTFRAFDGLVHLPAVTLLMVASNRQGGIGDSRGGAFGALASALMIGVAVGSPLGGWIVQFGPAWVYGTGSVLLVLAAVVATQMGAIPDTPRREGRYRWNWRAAFTWVPLGYGFMDRFSIGVFVSTFTIFLAEVHALSAAQRGVLIALFMLPFAILCYPVGRLADRRGWLAPMLVGNIAFGLLFASYGIVPSALLPAVMVLSGVCSALMFAPNLMLISDLARLGHGEGLFGAFQVAGSLGFLAGPIVGGILVAATRSDAAGPAYTAIFAGVGSLELVLAATSLVLLRSIERRVRSHRLDAAAA
ncbi:MAG: MFS transporter, partial [Gemmatimonadaceae bacterium]